MTAAAIKRRKRKQLKDGKLQIQSNRALKLRVP